MNMPEKGLSLPDFSALLVLAVEAREVSNTELKQRHKLTIDGQRRLRLNELKLVESRKQGRFMERTNQRLADVFHPDDTTGLPADQPADLEAGIRKAYAELAPGGGRWVSLTRFRPLLGDVPKAEVDTALVRMERLPDVDIVPESNQKTLTAQDREAAVIVGNQAKHLLWIGIP
jgi:hypothetical protein